MEYLVIKAYKNEKFLEFWNSFGRKEKIFDNIKYDEFVFDDIRITFYKNLTIMFNKKKLSEKLIEKIDILIDKNLYIGVDEVGVGENIGPYVSCAFKFNSFEDKKKAFLLGIRDSKSLKQDKINEVARELKKYGKKVCIILEPKKFNNYWQKLKNVKAINAIGQNKILNKIATGEKVIIDKFVNEKKYFNYLKENNQEIYSKNITFETKSEDKYLEVACSAIIAKSKYNKWLENYLIKNNIKNQKLNSNIIWKKIKNKELIIPDENELLKIWAINKLNN